MACGSDLRTSVGVDGPVSFSGAIGSGLSILTQATLDNPGLGAARDLDRRGWPHSRSENGRDRSRNRTIDRLRARADCFELAGG